MFAFESFPTMIPLHVEKVGKAFFYQTNPASLEHHWQVGLFPASLVPVLAFLEPALVYLELVPVAHESLLQLIYLLQLIHPHYFSPSILYIQPKHQKNVSCNEEGYRLP